MTDATSFPSRGFFEMVYQGRAPWDIGAPQPDLVALIGDFPPAGRIFDLGCGTGDLAIGLAGEGHQVLGVDFVSAAIEEARRRVATLEPEVRGRIELRVADALRPDDLAGEFESAVDSGFYHLFDAGTRRQLSRRLAAAIPPGGRYYMLGFAIEIPAPAVPREVKPEELTALFAADTGWRVAALRPARFRTIGFDEIPAVALCAERLRGDARG